MPNSMPSPDTPEANDVHAFVRRVPLFADAPERVIGIVADAVRRHTFEPNDVLFREGDRGEAVYLLRRGTVKLSKMDLAGHEKTLALLRPPEYFGEMAPLSGAPRSATAMAVDQVETLLLFADDFHRLMRDHHQIGLNVNLTLARRLHGMDDETQVLSYQDAQGRVAYVLLRLHKGGVIEFDDNDAPTVRLTHQELANMAGTSRETVTRALKALEAEAVIRTRPKEIVLVDLEGLAEILHDIR